MNNFSRPRFRVYLLLLLYIYCSSDADSCSIIIIIINTVYVGMSVLLYYLSRSYFFRGFIPYRVKQPK